MDRQEIERHAAQSIAAGSKSFAAASRLFDPATRRSVMLLYAWCRHCDDVIDGQQAGSPGVEDEPETALHRLAALRRDTARAVAGDVQGLHPAFAALAVVSRRHGIPHPLLGEHLDGFAMDVEGRRYQTLPELLVYCHRVAGVVGTMMARIMGVTGAETLAQAADLGLAFQLTNIARDMVDDAAGGRVYVPLEWLDEANLCPDDLTDAHKATAIAALRCRLVEAAEPFYASARRGIDALPRRSAFAIATAHGIYRLIGLRLVAAGPAAFGRRVATGRLDKLGMMARGAMIAYGLR